MATAERPPTVRQALAAATRRLRERGSPSPRLDAEVLLGDALGATREQLYGQPERVLSADELPRFEGFVDRRAECEPVAYIVGRKHFRGIELRLDQTTLIPRPETETLVEVALEKLRACGKDKPRLLDLGTGSGAVALALASEHPAVEVVATEADRERLEMARLNAARLMLADRVQFEASDLFDDLPAGARFDVIVSNPPYVTTDELGRLARDVRGYEPHVALLGGPDGLDFYRRIVPGAPTFLEPRGHLVVEIGETLAAEVARLFEGTGRYEGIEVRDDLGGRPRVVAGRERA